MSETVERIIKLATINEGGTYEGCEIALFETLPSTSGTEGAYLLEDGSYGIDSPIDLTGAKVLIQIKQVNSDIIYDTYTSETDGLYNSLGILTNVITFSEHIPILKFGNYIFDINVLFSNGFSQPGIGRGQWSIANPLTKR